MLGDRVKEIRKDNKLTQKEFAKQLLVSGSYISKIENGAEIPSDIFLKLCSLEFNVSTNWLIHGEGEKKISNHTFDYFDRANVSSYESLLDKDLIKFKQLLLSLPRESKSSSSFILENMLTIFEGESLKDTQKILLMEKIASIMHGLQELLSYKIQCSNKDSLDLYRFDLFYETIQKDIISALEEYKNILLL